MIHKPFVHALLATGYISLVVLCMHYAPKMLGESDSILVPVAMLSLFVLSAAIMGYLFLLQPAQLYLDGRKQEAVSFFLKTVGFFAGITVFVFILLFSVR